jgi:2-keto-4-pentenoate hydratase
LISFWHVITVSRSLERPRIGRCVRSSRRVGSTQWDALVARLELARQHRVMEPDVAISRGRPAVKCQLKEAARRVDAETRVQAAKILLNAYDTHRSVAPLTQRFPGFGVPDAYAVQLTQIEQWVADGAKVKGHKLGLTSAAMQRQLGVDQPDYGHLLDRMFLMEHVPIPPGRFLQPKVEPEIAFVLRKPLAGPGVTVAEAIAAVDFVLPALEIIDSRIEDWKITLADTIADNASSGGVVLGDRPAQLGAVDLSLAGCLFRRDGEIVRTGAGGAVLGSPVNALVWLANTLAAQGIALEAGHVVLSGSVTEAVPASTGTVFTAIFAGLGAVTATFAAPAAGGAGMEGSND